MLILKRKICKCGRKAAPNRRKCQRCIWAEQRSKAESSKLARKEKHEKTKTYRQELHDKAWKLMSLYIRLKWADENGMVKCYSCDEVHHYKDQLHAGHLWHSRIDFCEDNLRPQCSGCNTYHSDTSMPEYAARRLNDLGEAKFKELRLYANQKGNDYSVVELRDIIADLKVKLATLSK